MQRLSIGGTKNLLDLNNLNSKLSPNFTLKELCRTSHREFNNIPSVIIAGRLEILAVNYLEPIRDVFGPIRINSGYRSPLVNKAIGGSDVSAHMDGCAADFEPMDSNKKLQPIVDWIIEESGMPFDQVILESSGTSDWIHIGMTQPNRVNGPRKEALRFKDGKYTKYDKHIDYGE